MVELSRRLEIILHVMHKERNPANNGSGIRRSFQVA
jgi:hypothetical protein